VIEKHSGKILHLPISENKASHIVSRMMGNKPVESPEKKQQQERRETRPFSEILKEINTLLSR
jgi:hypothetical protein